MYFSDLLDTMKKNTMTSVHSVLVVSSKKKQFRSLVFYKQ